MINRYWLAIFVPVWLGFNAADLFGVFDGWRWWQKWGVYIALCVLASVLGDDLAEMAKARKADRETPPP